MPLRRRAAYNSYQQILRGLDTFPLNCKLTTDALVSPIQTTRIILSFTAQMEESKSIDAVAADIRSNTRDDTLRRDMIELRGVVAALAERRQQITGQVEALEVRLNQLGVQNQRLLREMEAVSASMPVSVRKSAANARPAAALAQRDQ